jgi:hypothetical protein
MKNILAVAANMAALLLCGAAWTQSTTPATSDPMSGQAGAAVNQPGQTPKIAPGSVIPVQLTKSIDAKKAKAGDEVIARVTRDLKADSGEVLVAKGTKVIGHVTQAQGRTKEQRESEVGIAFDHAATKSGDIKLPMSIQAIIAPLPSNPSGGDSGSYGQSGPATGGGTTTSPMSGRSPVSGGSQPQPQALPTGGSEAQARPPITGNTRGVIGMADVKLENAQNGAQGSIVSSEKSNVKLESGTVLLLRVNQ